MVFHVVSLPHTQTTKEYSWCAYTEKVRKFCNMMTDLGHEVYLYASEDNEARCKELVTCIEKYEQPKDIPVFAIDTPCFKMMNERAIEAIGARIKPHDFICLIGGLTQKPIADAFPDHMSVEFGIGYGGTFAPYQVFESYAWMHTVYGNHAPDPHAADGRWYDAVIPNYFEIEDFPLAVEKEDYYLYVGRLIDRKGLHIAQEVCEKLGKRLIVAGQGDFKGYGEFIGTIGPKERGELMSKARALFVPTLYLEPFGGVHIEAMLCGTPVITTDWGVFTETVIDGFNGLRCRSFEDFVAATNLVRLLDPKAIREWARARYSTKVVAKQYEQYFERLMTLWGDGWYAKK